MNSSPSKTLADRQLAPVSLAIARFLCLGLGLLVAAPCAEHSLVASAVGQEQKKTSEKKIEQSDKKKQNDDKKDTGKDQGADKQDNEEEAATEESKEQVRNAFQQLGGMIQEAVAEAADEEPFVDEHFDGGITLDENRDLRRRFDIAKRQIEQGNVADTVKFLGEFLTDTDTKDFFLAPTSRGRMRQSFRAAVQQLIGSLPEDGKESYELLFGGRAQKLLEQAVADRNWNLLHDVVRGYYHTQAGGQALYLLGSHYLDLDRPREALVCLERLQELDQSQSMQPRLSALITAARYRTGDVEAAIQDVQQMRDTSPESLTLLATAPRSKPPTADQLADPNAIRAWLASMLGSPSTAGNSLTANWDTFRGGPSRNVKANASTPLLSSQAQHEIGSPYAIKSVSSYRKAMNSAKMAVLPMLHPVVIGENALISTDAGLSVRHLATGDTWSYPSASASVSLESHFWCSSAFGMPSTNGQLAFVVEGQADVAGMGSHGHEMLMMRQVGFRRGFGGPFFVGNHTGSTGGHLTNSLTAVDLASKGKRRWRVGGADGREEPLLAGAYFLGSPLPYGGRVYSVAEFKGSLRLLALNAETGKLEWNQELAIAESAISADMFRRMAGATPSVADGIIVCPTSCGGVVALDLTTQSLAWAYRYPRRRETISNQNHYYNNTSGTSLDQGDRWIDATAVISDGCVIITPMESDEVHCLDLRTGELKWKKPRGKNQKNLFVACVDDGKCVMVGRDRVIAWNLDDGKPSWKEPLKLPESAYPAGQGVHMSGEYLLPLSNASLARIDLSVGTISDVQFTRRELPLGNLIFANGEFLSLGPRYLETFPQREKLLKSARAALAADGNDAQAMTQLGELAQADGVIDEAIDHYRKAYVIQPTPRRKSLLVAALLTGIRQKLPSAADYDELLKNLSGE